MKKFLKIFFFIILVLFILGIIFYMIDTTRVYNDEEPIFTFNQKLVDGINYSGKIDIGLGYKIIRFDISNKNIIEIGSIFMDEDPPEIEIIPDVEKTSGESGEEIVKITTFGEKYKDIVLIEGLEEEVYAKEIKSKLDYTMKYYYDLFEYTGFEDYDRYLWNKSSGDYKALMTVYDISNEEVYKDSLEMIEKEKLFEELSGDQTLGLQKLYYRTFEEDNIQKVNYIYLLESEDLKLMVDLYYLKEAEEGIGVYMHKMSKSIEFLK